MTQTQPLNLTSASLPPGLYIVATPIGNLSDITLRALQTLHAADIIACEDTRITRRLLNHYGINAQTISYHDHNAEAMRPAILARLEAGEAVALVSDAGTPLISDPGYKLVRAVQEAGYLVSPIPGPSSVITALCLAGLPTDRFCFTGFLPGTMQARRKEIEELARIPATLVVFESANRLTESLTDLAEIMGPRQAAVTRELTKLFEESRRGTLQELAQHYTQHPDVKGEIVLVIAPPEQAAPDADAMDKALKDALSRLSVKDAVAEVAASFNLPRNIVYARALELK